MLAGIAALYRDCESVLMAGPAPVRQRVSGGSRSHGIALQEDTLRVRSDIVRTLSSWICLLVDERSLQRPASLEPERLVETLLNHLSWLLAHPAGADFVEELLGVSRRAHRVLNRAGGSRMELGACTHAGCGAALEFLEPELGGVRSEIRCISGHRWPPDKWLHLARHTRRKR